LVYLVFFILVVLIYFQTWQFTLGNLDDEILIINPLPFLQDWKNIPDAFARDVFLSRQGSWYRPLQVISFMIDTQFINTGSVYYVTNTLLHFGACCALFYLLTLVGSDRKGAFIFTLLFLAAPLFVSAVAWAPGRGDLMIGLTGILSLAFFIKMLVSGKAKFGVLSLITFTVAVFSKETAVMIPVMLFLYYLAKRKESNLKPSFGIMIFAGFFLIMLTYFILRSQVVSTSLIASDFNPINVLHNLRTFPEFLAKFLIPVELSPMPAFSLFPTILGMLVFAALLAGIFRFTPKPYFEGLFGLIWFIAFTLPGAMFIHKFGTSAYDYLEHRAYLPMAGIMLSLFAIYNGLRTDKAKTNFNTVMILYAIILGIYSYVYVRNYKEPMAFYGRALSTNPASAMAHVNRGFVRINYMNDPQTALMDFNSALGLKPDYALAYMNKGVVLYKMNEKAAAIAQYDSAIKYDPTDYQAYFNKALALSGLGYNKEAIAECTRAVKIRPSRAIIHAVKGAIFLELDDLPAAQLEISLALRLDPNDALALSRRGLIRYKQNDPEGACADWSKAAALNYEEANYFLQTYCR